MKRFSIYIYILIIGSGLSACKKDKGNYDYSKVDLPQIDTAAIEASYSVEQFSKLNIVPKIDYAGDTANLSYEWFTYIKSPSSYSDVPRKLLAQTRELNTSIEIPPGNYYLELVVTDKTNGAKINNQTLLNVLASMETGWLVLHTDNNETDVDFISSKNLSPIGIDKRIRNMFETIDGAKMKGEAQMLGYSRRPNSAFNYITVGNKEGIKRMNGFTFAPMGADQALFRRPLTVKNFQAHINNGSNELIINDGALQAISWSAVPDALYGGVFNGDYYLAPYLVINDYASYGTVVYDQKYGKFMYTTDATSELNFIQFKPAAATEPAQAFSPSNVGKDMLFMDRGFNKDVYAFFKDKTGSGRYLYILNITNADAGNLAVAAYDMTALPEIQNAKYFQVGDIGNVALYATDKTVYRFDYSGSQTATVAFDGIPVGEAITCMRIYKPRLNSNSYSTEFAATNNTVLYIATWNGTEGKLYEMGMNVASGAINPTPLKTYGGFGKIKDMIAKFRGSGI